MTDLAKHPSDVAKAATKYLANLDGSTKTKRQAEEVLWLFIESLKGDASDCVAPNREAVDRFYDAAMKQGGSNDGPPGIRENYDPGYYAAFVRDPDGHRIEAVVHEKPISEGQK